MSSEATNHFVGVLNRVWDGISSIDNPITKRYQENTLALPLKKLISDQTPNKTALLACKALLEYKIFEIRFFQFMHDHPVLSAAVVVAATTTLVFLTASGISANMLFLYSMVAFLAYIAIRWAGVKFVKENETLKALLEDLSKEISAWDPQNADKRIAQ